MIIRASGNIRPVLAASARGAENAVLIGDVQLEEHVSVWYGAVLRGDTCTIRVGAGSNIQDLCALHCSGGQPLTIGKMWWWATGPFFTVALWRTAVWWAWGPSCWTAA